MPHGRAYRERVSSAVAFILVMFSVVILNIPSLLRPAPPADACGVARPVLGPLVRFQNCDSHVFNLIASRWDQLFTESGETRLSRPVFLAAGWLMDRFVFLASLGAVDPSEAEAPYFELAEVGFVILNVLVVTAAIALALRLVLGADWRPGAVGRQWPIALFLVVALAATPVSKAFLWTSHTQMLTILIPVVALMATRWALSTQSSVLTAGLIGLAIGVGILTYASSVILALAIATAFAVRRRYPQALVTLVGAAVFPVAWVLGVRIATGDFYSVETEKFRQFVWVLDGLGDGSVISKTQENVDGFLRSFFEGQTLLALAVVITLLLLVAFSSRFNPPSPQDDFRILGLSTAIVLAWYVIFLFAMGFYQTRLSWALVITLIVATSALVANTFLHKGHPNRPVVAALFGATVVWYAAWITIPEPWF